MHKTTKSSTQKMFEATYGDTYQVRYEDADTGLIMLTGTLGAHNSGYQIRKDLGEGRSRVLYFPYSQMSVLNLAQRKIVL